MTIRNDIIDRATDELEIVDRQLLQLPNLINKVLVQKHNKQKYLNLQTFLLIFYMILKKP